jgi:hypothetical protein
MQGDVIVLDSPRLRYTPGIGIEAFLNPESIVFRNPGGSKEVCPLLANGRTRGNETGYLTFSL